MPTTRVLNTGGLNLYINPILTGNSLIRAVNVTSEPYGAKSKRSGYTTYLGTPDTAQVNSLFSWTKDDGTTLYTYRASGSVLYYSTQGTGTWTVCGNGTIGASAKVDTTVLNNTLFIADGVGTLRYTTSGTDFTYGSLAPVAVSLNMYQNRIYATGTSSTLFYSTTGDGTNWNTSGTSDSSSLTIPGAGKLLKLIKASDRLISTKNSGLMYRWDGYNLVDTATELGPTSGFAVARKEGYYMYLNRDGIYGFGGGKPQLLSNPIQQQIYNNSGSGIPGAVFDSANGGIHRYDYFVSAGTVTDEFTSQTISNAIIKYDFNKNEFLNYRFNNYPTAWHSYKDANGVQQLIVGDASGQCYQISPSSTTDNGVAIEVSMEFFFTGEAPELEKKFDFLDLYFNPGNEAQVMVAIGDTFSNAQKKWIPVGDCSEGHTEFKFPAGSRGRFLFVKIIEASKTATFKFYGYAVTYEFIKR